MSGAEEPAVRLLRDCPLCRAASHAPLFEREGYRHVRCRGCGFVFVNPQPADDLAVSERLYGSDHEGMARLEQRLAAMSAEELRAFVEDLERPPRRLRRELDLVERFRGGGRLLDVGCAGGRFLVAARARGFAVFGVEAAEEAARVGRRFFGLDLHVGPLDSYQAAEPFDVVRANQVIEHLQDPARFLRRLAELVRPGGLVIVATVNYASLSRMLIGPRWRHLGNARNGHVSFFTTRTLRRALRDAGLAMIHRETAGLRFRNPGEPAFPGVRRLEKTLGPVAGMLGLGGRVKAFAVRRG